MNNILNDKVRPNIKLFILIVYCIMVLTYDQMLNQVFFTVTEDFEINLTSFQDNFFLQLFK